MLNKSKAIGLLAACLFLLGGCGGSTSSDTLLTLDTLCGSESLPEKTTKIVGGRQCMSPNGTLVRILLFDEEDNQTICSGVRLNGSTILTAAHCFNEFVFSVLVELSSGERIAPTKIIPHPKAADLGSMFINDVALITISPPDGDAALPQIRIAQRVDPGSDLTILGYGVTDGVNQIGSGLLRVGKMRADEVTSDLIFSDYTPPTLSNTCFGDSGGPAFIEDEDGGLVLAGITSTGTNVRCLVGDRSAFANLTNQALRAFVEEGM